MAIRLAKHYLRKRNKKATISMLLLYIYLINHVIYEKQEEKVT